MFVYNTMTLARAMNSSPDEFSGFRLSAFRIRFKCATGEMPSLQHEIKDNALVRAANAGKRWTFAPTEILMWIAFGGDKRAAIEVVRRRDLDQVAAGISKKYE